MIRNKLSIIKKTLIYVFFRYFKKKNKYTEPLKLHLGCGSVYLKNYVNVDVSTDSVADIVSDFRDIFKLYPKNSVTEILMVHSISYLRLWEGLDFFEQCYQLLTKNGILILEFPDLEKCATYIIQNKNNYNNYIEGVRGLYAFDLDQIKNRESFYTYSFGWSSWHISDELKKLGFSSIVESDGNLHNNKWRDTRIEATK